MKLTAWFTVIALMSTQFSPVGFCAEDAAAQAEAQKRAAAASKPAADIDMLVNVHGERLRCKVLEIEPDGVVRFTASWLRGESRAKLLGLRRLKFKATHAEAGKDIVLITNGDVIDGKVLAVTDEHVQVQSPLMGTLAIPRPMVRKIIRGSMSRMLSATNFADGELGAWKPVTGRWSVADGFLHCRDMNNQHGIAVPVKQTDSLTVEFKMEGIMPWNMEYQVSLFADGRQRGREGNFVMLSFNRQSYWVQYTAPGKGSRHVGSFNYTAFNTLNNNEPPKGTIRIAYDLKKKRITTWINGAQVGQQNMPEMPKKGKFIILRTRWGERTQYVHIYPGVVPPPKQDADEGKKDVHVLVMNNDDRVSSPHFTFEGEHFLTEIAGAEFRGPIARIAQIIMPAQSQIRPRRNKGDSRVVTGRGGLTFVITGMNATHLTGRCAYLGDVKIARAALKRIELDIYTAPKPKAGMSSSSATPSDFRGPFLNDIPIM